MTKGFPARTIYWASCVVIGVVAMVRFQPGVFDGGVGLDKGLHVLGFGWMTYWGLRAYPARTHLILYGLCIYGLLIEGLQGISGWRVADGKDMVANLMGIGLGWAMVTLSPKRP